MLKLGLSTIGFGAPVWALIVVWFSLGAAVGLGIAGMAALIASGFIDYEPDDERAVHALDNLKARELL